MSVRTDTINLNVNINGNQAQNQLNDLSKKARDTKLEMDGLKKSSQEYADKKAELKKMTDQMSDLKKEIGITSLTQKELISELNKLKALKGSVTPFTQEFKDLQKQIEAVESRLYDVKNGVQGFASFFSKIKDEVKQFGVAAAAYLGFEFITSQFSNILRGAGKLSDGLADIRRVTGLTADEVKVLNAQLSALDTRTSTEGLRNIAIVAGKLGVAKDDILGFVKATDMLVVALGDELGDADQITTQLGKIINVFDKGDGKVTGEKLSSIGNAIVDLANKGVASGGFIVDFTQRMAGLAKTANLSLDAVMGLAAGLEESGQKTESSSTAVIKVLSQMGTDVPKFAKVAGVSVEEFSKTMREKPIEALIKVSEGFTKGKDSFEEISKAFANAGEDGAKIVSTLGVIGGKADFFRGKIDATAIALTKNNEITDAFDLKNQTLGATLDKLGKEFNRLMSSAAVTNFLKSAVNGITDFIKWLKDLPAWLNENRTSLIVLSGVVLTYVAAQTKATQASILNRLATLLEIGADKLDAAQKAISAAMTTAYAYAKDVLTGKIKLATVAQQLWNLAIKANPIGVFIVLLTAVAASISFLAKKFTELTDIQKLHQDIQRKAGESTADEEAKIRSLSLVVGNSAISLQTRKKALQELIAINPQYLSGLTLENIKTQEGINIINNYVKAIRQKAMAQAATDAQADKMKEDIKLQQQQYELEKKIAQGRTGLSDLSEAEQGYVGSTRKQFNFTASVTDLATGGSAAQEALDAIKAQRTHIQTELDVTDEIISKNYISQIGNIDKGTAATVTETGKAVLQTAGAIRAEIKKLKKEFNDIDPSNKEALQDNVNRRKELQKQLDEMEGKAPKKTKEQRTEESEYSKLKKEAAQFKKDVEKIREQLAVGDADENEKEITRINQKYADLLKKAADYYTKVAALKNAPGKEKVLSGISAEEEELKQMRLEELRQEFNKRTDKAAEKEYEESLKLSTEFFEHEKVLAGKNYADGITNKEEYEQTLTRITQREAENRVIIDQDYSKTVKKAAESLLKSKVDLDTKVTDATIQQNEKRKELENQHQSSEAKLAVLQTRQGTQARFDAEKKALQTEFEIKTEGWKKESEAYKDAVAERIQTEKDLEKQHQLEKLDQVMQYVGFFQDAMSSLNQILSNRENKLLAEERARNNVKKKDYKSQLDSKLISQNQYDLKVQQLDDEQARKEQEARVKQAKREKALAIFNALVNTAAAITKTFVEFGWPLGIPMAAAMAVTGGLQVAAIANAPLPEMGTGGLLDEGPYHRDSDKGLHVVDPRTGKTKMLLEKDEAVIKGDAIRDAKQYSVTGTPSQIASALNAMHGGIDWAGGAIVDMPNWRTKRPANINPSMARIMEQGGLVRSIEGKSPAGNSADTNDLLRQLVAKQEEQTDEIRNMKTRLHAVVSIKEYREEEAKYDDAKKASGMS